MTTESLNTVRVRYFGLARNAVGRDEEDLQLPRGSSVRDLMTHLASKNGDGFRASVMTTDGRLRYTSQVLIGDTAVQDLNGMDTPLVEGTPVTIMIIVYPTDGG